MSEPTKKDAMRSEVAWLSGSASRAPASKRQYLALHCDRDCSTAVVVERRSGLLPVPSQFWRDIKPCQVCALRNADWHWHPSAIPPQSFYAWWDAL